MGAPHTTWKDAKKKVPSIDPLFKEGLGGLLDKAESAYKDFKKDEKDLGKVPTRVDAVKVAVAAAEDQAKDYKATIQSTKATPGKAKAISLFMDREKDILRPALTGIGTTPKTSKDEAGRAKLPTVEEYKAFLGRHTSDVLRTAGL